MKEVFHAKALSIREIIDLLKSQGLTIEDENRAEHILRNVSYTRLKNYLVSLMQNRHPRRFIPGTTFEDAYALYGFDRRLRELIFHEIEKVEISIRTHIAYASNGSENGYWFLNPEHFKNDRQHEALIRRLRNEIARSDNEAIINFKKRYSNEFPPSWLTLEATSMGTLASIYEEMRDSDIKTRIADYYGLSPETFSSWLWHLVSVRNDCAHHNRVWNSAPSTPAALPEWTRNIFPELTEEDRSHIYMTLCIIKYLQNTVKPTNTFASRLKSLIGNFKIIKASRMGFPEDWSSQEFWKG